MKCLIKFAVTLSIAATLTVTAAHATSPGSNSSHPSKHVSQPPVTPSSSNVSQRSQTRSSANSSSKSASKSAADARSSSNSHSNSAATASGGQARQAQRQSNTNESSGNAAVGPITLEAAPVTNVGGSSDQQEVTIHGDTYEAPKIPVASAASGGTNTTADCRYSVGAGGQASFLGLSFGIGRKDRDCERVALADMFYARGNPEAGDMIMCRVKELREAFGADCLAMLARSRPATPTERQLRMREEFLRGGHQK